MNGFGKEPVKTVKKADIEADGKTAVTRSLGLRTFLSGNKGKVLKPA